LHNGCTTVQSIGGHNWLDGKQGLDLFYGIRDGEAFTDWLPDTETWISIVLL
jgi:hypothetical protein